MPETIPATMMKIDSMVEKIKKYENLIKYYANLHLNTSASSIQNQFLNHHPG